MTNNSRPVAIRTDFPGSALDDVFTAPLFAVLRQSIKGHDVLRLRFTSDIPDPSKVLRTGAPVTMTWSTNSTDEKTWYGYVHSTSPRRETDTTYSTEVTCVSPSYILSSASQDVWNTQYVTTTASNIIATNRLRPLVAAHPLSKTVLAAGRTYWEVLRDIADETGLSLLCDGTDIIMVPTYEFFDQYHGNARVFHKGTTTQNNVRESDRSLWSFTPVVSDRLQNEYSDPSLAVSWWVDPTTAAYGKTVTTAPQRLSGTRDRYPQTTTYTSRVSYSDSESFQRGSDRLSSKRWIQQAELIGSGSSVVSPYRPVYVSDYHKAADGWWQVLDVTHTIHRLTSYEVTATVGRDGSNISYPAPQDPPVISDQNLARGWKSSRPTFIDRSYSVGGRMGFGDVDGMWSAVQAS